MSHMIIRKRSYRKIAVVVAILPSNIHFTLSIRSLDKVFRQQLALLVEVIRRALNQYSQLRLASQTWVQTYDID